MARLPGGKDVITQPLYDSGSATSATVQVVLFQTPIGQGTTIWGSAGGRVLDDTNMTLAGQLPAGWSFDAYTVQFQVDPNVTSANLAILLDSGTLEVVVGAKQQFLCPLVALGSGAGISGDVATGVVATLVEFAGNGVPNAKSVFAMGDQPISIYSNENFFARVLWATLTGLAGTVKFRVLMNGVLARGIQ